MTVDQYILDDTWAASIERRGGGEDNVTVFLRHDDGPTDYQKCRTSIVMTESTVRNLYAALNEEEIQF